MWTLTIIWGNGNESVYSFPSEADCWEKAYDLVDEPGCEVFVEKD